MSLFGSETRKKTHLEVLKDIFEVVHAQYKPSATEADRRLEIRILPGAVSLLVRDQELFASMFPEQSKNLGFYYPPHLNKSDNWLNGRVIVVNKSHSGALDIEKHEYLHFLNSIYFMPNELPIFSDKETNMRFQELADTNLLLELQNETGGVEPEKLARLIARKQAVQEKLENNLNESPEYFSLPAKSFFRQVRDELSAYTLTETIQTNESTLLRGGVKWRESIEKISHPLDREKIENGWSRLKPLLEQCEERKIPSRDLLPIFITSQNFEEISKRISLLFESTKPIHD